jgi:CBS domain containing-hemolysin-like protein
LRAEIEALDDETNEEMSSGIRQIVGNTLQLRNLDAQDILMPRNQIQVLELNDPIEKNLALAKSSGHTRFPLCDGDLDHCVGIVHIKDVFRQMAEGKEVKLEDIKRDFSTFSPEVPLIEVLQKMLRGRLHMALVRDEFGGAIGVVTLEDALEEVVGEIKDEFDAGEEDPIRKRDDDSFFIAGLAQTHDVEEILGIKFGNDEVSTFGGWITMALGRIPQTGESFLLSNLEITVEKAEDGRVIETSVKPIDPEPNEHNSGD